MKTKLFLHIAIVAMVFFSFGCSKPKSAAKPKETKNQFIQYVQSPELAKVILKSDQKPLTIVKDPFKPILTKQQMGLGSASASSKSQNNAPAGGKTGAEDVILVGVIKMDNEVRAFLKTPNKSGVFKVQDKIENYTIAKISLDEVVLKSGDVEIVRKRGKL